MNVVLLTGVARFNVADSKRNWSQMLVDVKKKKRKERKIRLFTSLIDIASQWIIGYLKRRLTNVPINFSILRSRLRRLCLF